MKGSYVLLMYRPPKRLHALSHEWPQWPLTHLSPGSCKRLFPSSPVRDLDCGRRRAAGGMALVLRGENLSVLQHRPRLGRLLAKFASLVPQRCARITYMA